ncbi:LacI family DNA-binding transcriptional regulator [Priestia megaterium]|jgi:LacI family transcriptional regulator|uniref:LacI family DNA-binding transcriptional regulator n=1 Tax=Priestia megaterium TaxID=1404 RepID=UPI000BEC7DEE|nr:LacI family DNA-binding transcriptional regulator [Priestia megaterium]MDP9576590.1 LacI family transcriptional regulator [Bacillus sp. 1751]MBD8112572.1 LacI family DNA-binding transcriptional regulator [Priestia megaterium]MDH2359898.1 LacI family DNA-binding transcriptional regulator [Priestia megaterium]PEA36227.1 LacI family transcriptional regulator [Priestia megaterium]PED66749.1 LacI family transcriptional regulator [Priestia megaterium]
MSVSIKDVALKAGVSTASVSRVLTNKPGVGAKTAERIRKVMEELDYRPNLGARGLVKQNTGNIAVVVPRGSFILNNPFFSTVLEGIAKGIDQTDYNMMMSFTSSQQKRLLETQAVDGVILFAPRNEELSLEWLESIRLPIVVVGSYLEGSPFPCVRPDDEDGIKQAVDALYHLGHRNIGIVNGPMSSMHSVRCLNGYKKKMDELGLPFSSENVFEIDEFDALKATTEVATFLKKHSNITGVVCSSDYLAIGVIKAANMLGLSVPKDLSVVGADDVPISDFITPALSTVHVDLLGVGQRATSILMNMLEGKQIRKKDVVFKMEYINRSTTDSPKHN